MPKSTTTPFTARIRSQCKASGISLREFMRRIGMANSAITRWETGYPPRAETVATVERVLEEMEK